MSLTIDVKRLPSSAPISLDRYKVKKILLDNILVWQSSVMLHNPVLAGSEINHVWSDAGEAAGHPRIHREIMQQGHIYYARTNARCWGYAHSEAYQTYLSVSLGSSKLVQKNGDHDTSYVPAHQLVTCTGNQQMTSKVAMLSVDSVSPMVLPPRQALSQAPGGITPVSGTPTPAPVIKAHPQSCTAAWDSTVQFTVQAEGAGLTYQWEYCDSGQSEWAKCYLPGHDTDTLTVTATNYRNGMKFRCVVAAGVQVDLTGDWLRRASSQGSLGTKDTMLVDITELYAAGYRTPEAIWQKIGFFRGEKEIDL